MSTKIKYDSFGNSIDGTDYCTGVETFAQNLIEDNESDATMTFPSANGWISPRSETYKLEDVNAQIILPKNIYNQPNVKISVSYGNAKKDLIEFYDRAENRTYYLMYAIDKTGKEQNYIDISDFVVSDTIHGIETHVMDTHTTSRNIEIGVAGIALAQSKSRLLSEEEKAAMQLSARQLLNHAENGGKGIVEPAKIEIAPTEEETDVPETPPEKSETAEKNASLVSFDGLGGKA